VEKSKSQAPNHKQIQIKPFQGLRERGQSPRKFKTNSSQQKVCFEHLDFGIVWLFGI